ncbi:MAG: hypothetical protein ACKVIW_15820, partial [bacterium]
IGLGFVREAVPWALGQVAIGGAIYGGMTLVVVRFIGDEPMQMGLSALTSRLSSLVRKDSA